MRLIDNHIAEANLDSRQVVWFGRRGSIRVSGSLGTSGALALHWRPTEQSPDVKVADLMSGNNEINPDSGHLFVRFAAGSDAPSLTVDLFERPLGY